MGGPQVAESEGVEPLVGVVLAEAVAVPVAAREVGQSAEVVQHWRWVWSWA